MFRWPKPTAAESARFYEGAYSEGSVTDLPDFAAAARFAREGFGGSGLDCTPHVNVMLDVARSGRALDYGASWGYTVHQLRAAGFDAVGYELSKTRARFGREHLGVEVTSDMRAFAAASFDAIHTSHVMEHVADLARSFTDLRRVLRPGGALVIFVPNCGGPSAMRLGVEWGAMISEAHVNALTGGFLAGALATFGFRSEVRDGSDELCVVAHLCP